MPAGWYVGTMGALVTSMRCKLSTRTKAKVSLKQRGLTRYNLKSVQLQSHQMAARRVLDQHNNGKIVQQVQEQRIYQKIACPVMVHVLYHLSLIPRSHLHHVHFLIHNC